MAKHTKNSDVKDDNEHWLEAEEGKEESENEELDFYLKTIENLGKERDENYDLLLRKQAEFENYRKRVEKEKEELRITAQAEVIRELLAILDAFEKGLRTLEEGSKDSQLETYRQGYELMLKEFRSILEKFGVTEIPGTGAPFDPNVHEAVLTEMTTEYQEGEILDEYRKGYKIKGRLLRPSQVKVAVQPDGLSVGQEKWQEEGE
ncbi:nucleotide exchange factor GrpE [Acidobacteria bacterium AH-259-O06]|nr:nucleotide exchange factor GrpE [Acidobacteria bacterium AH-259-O06]